MSYAVYTDIQSEFKSIDFTASNSVLSTTEVTEFITQEEALLDGEVSQIYEIPVTGTQAISIMKLMTILMVKARIVDILVVKTGTSSPDQGSSGDALRTRCKDLLEKIMKKVILLPEATLLSSSGGVKSYTVDNDLTPLFEREDTSSGVPSQW